VCWEHEDDPGCVKPLDDAYWQRMALCNGAKQYPELAQLIPRRPAHVLTCEMCGGRGTLVQLPEATCQCGGLGWMLPGELQRLTE
jgi:hypothetical protein